MYNNMLKHDRHGDKLYIRLRLPHASLPANPEPTDDTP